MTRSLCTFETIGVEEQISGGALMSAQGGDGSRRGRGGAVPGDWRNAQDADVRRREQESDVDTARWMLRVSKDVPNECRAIHVTLYCHE